ncbi:hypothetical protein BKA65DRAFT_472295 [Rhexocercosporidium sp. MPI-PUGE-AT-0058]|nr:hypothetical protein BKA65DRAFT_472295 [Rhexocercosporidium sp. MPI-PUGE-AT-0058]
MPAPLSSNFHSRLSKTSTRRGISDFSEATAFPTQYVNCTACYKKKWVFDLQELVRVAITATSEEGARRCIEVLKCKEGMNNRAFLLTMDNGSVVFAKLPNACAGPAFYTTASEVATRTFLREVLGIPTPRIIAWSTQRTNSVGAEYILEERARGQPLWTLWQDWNRL